MWHRPGSAYPANTGTRHSAGVSQCQHVATRRARSRQLGNGPALGTVLEATFDNSPARSRCKAARWQSSRGRASVEPSWWPTPVYRGRRRRLFLADSRLMRTSAVPEQGHVTLAGLTTVNAAYSIGQRHHHHRRRRRNFSGARPGLEFGRSAGCRGGDHPRPGCAPESATRTLALRGTLTGTGGVTVSGLFTWTNGWLRGSG